MADSGIGSASSSVGDPGTVSGKMRRSGSENRQRTRQRKLSLLPHEDDVMQRLADEDGFATIQQYILRNFIQPLVDEATSGSLDTPRRDLPARWDGSTG